uniref:tRNA lysidine(34) synthetase TilS n=1 Tax=Patulibacter defluvii TaxID=3095358 RepID=UPI002A759D6A
MGEQRDLLARLAASGEVAAGAPVVVACSGGRDSLCLLDLAVRVAGAKAVLAVHVHHGLRGTAADRDAAHAAAAAARLGTALRAVRLSPPDDLGGSPAVWAREARWRALRAAADRWDPAAEVLLGHTASDQAETVLLRAISSPGTRALAAMPVRDGERRLRRPLLAIGATRADAGAWCAAHGLRWRDDGSNPTGPRGRVRAALAGLEAVDRRAVAALAATAARAREDDEALTAAAAAMVAADASPGVAA